MARVVCALLVVSLACSVQATQSDPYGDIVAWVQLHGSPNAHYFNPPSPCDRDNGGCSPWASCQHPHNDTSDLKCTCLPGFAGDGFSCDDLDECAENNGGCAPEAVCFNVVGGRNCMCPRGLEGNGLTCDVSALPPEFYGDDKTGGPPKDDPWPSEESTTGVVHAYSKRQATDPCNYIYISYSGTAAGAGTSLDPTNLAGAMAIYQTTPSRNVIRAVGGTYSFSSKVTWLSGLSLDGGYYDAGGGRWYKTANPQSTWFNFNPPAEAHPSGDYGHFIGIDCSSRSSFAFRDFFLSVSLYTPPSGVTNNRGRSVYGFLLSGASNFEMTRVTVQTGKATDANPGAAYPYVGADGAQGGGGYGGLCDCGNIAGCNCGHSPGGGQGGTSGGGVGGGSSSGCQNGGPGGWRPASSDGGGGGGGGAGGWNFGYNGGGGGSGGFGDTGYAAPGTNTIVGPGGTGQDGYDGGVGSNGYDGPTCTTRATNYDLNFYFVPGPQAPSGGNAGGGGGGGGGTGSSGDGKPSFANGVGNAGGGGAGGGQGGLGGYGGFGGGGAFAFYGYGTNPANAIVVSCVGYPGSVGVGGVGGAGGNPGNGGPATGRRGDCSGEVKTAGFGAAGGRGGYGGGGCPGANGVKNDFQFLTNINGTTAPLFDLYIWHMGCTNSEVTLIASLSPSVVWQGLNFVKDRNNSTSSYTVNSQTAVVYWTSLGSQSILPQNYAPLYNIVDIRTSRAAPSISLSGSIGTGGCFNMGTPITFTATPAGADKYEFFVFPAATDVRYSVSNSTLATFSWTPTAVTSYSVRLRVYTACCLWSIPAYEFWVMCIPPTTGTTGSTRSTGSTGSTGSARSSGSTGSTRSTGSTGSTQSTGSTGSVRSTGSTGSTRSSGSTGTTQSTGSTGSTQSSGSTGSTGSTRSTGSSGSTRSSGSTGSTQSTGSTGSTQSTGSSGSTRSSGSTGTTQSTGSTGSTQSSGSTGSTQSTGSSGSTGSARSSGSTGTTQSTGSTGSTQSSGSTGSTGSARSTGSSGSTGSTRSTGSSGSTGSSQSTGSTGSTQSTGSSGSTQSSGSTGSTRSSGSTGTTQST
eukprot:TRINITY_DN3934_c0_g4_i1.p1 TRINITY_DN3934_c0_g4~~TRINITY_DN3934_c0_g4_i1.p1  ORF type:complete len:1074 (-),score=236.00 TRINITY_DN3934_c0_g4_i1:25-3246(-)